MIKYRDWEEERIKLQLMQGSTAQNNLDSTFDNGDGPGEKHLNPNEELYGAGTPQ